MSEHYELDADSEYAEGKRVATTCRECGRPAWIVYHGPHRNHTIEARSVPDPAAQALAEAVRVTRFEFGVVNPGLSTADRDRLIAALTIFDQATQEEET